MSNAERRTADYHPSEWGDHFLTHVSDLTMNHDSVQRQIKKLKVEVKRKFGAAYREPLEKLHMIDQIQCLGIAYQFEREIDESLKQIYKLYFEHGYGHHSDHDLYTTALLFRILRQHGYRISSDVFLKFKNANTGSFKESLAADTRGLLSLYEASHLRVHREDILEEALALSLSHLNRALEKYKDNDHQNNIESASIINGSTSPSLAAQVGRALKQCLWKGLRRMEARHYISVYEEEDSHSEVLLTLAKLDFNLLQKQHQQELHNISRWWKGLDMIGKPPFARDRCVECYFLMLGVCFEPRYSLAREILVKVLLLTSVMDDIYDAYGTFEELQLLTDAIERWDIEMIDRLPEYMQVFFKALLDLFDAIDEMLADEEGRSYRMLYAKEAMKRQARTYFDEAKWLNQQRIPTVEEYMSVALVSSGIIMLTTISFLRMGHIATEHAFRWSLSNHNKAARAASIIARLTDDIVTHKFEQERGHIASAVECFMEQHSVTEQQAKEELWKEVDDAWKDTNEVCLRPHPILEPLLTQVLNLARLVHVIYKDNKDRYTHPDPESKQTVASILIDPVPYDDWILG